MNESHFHEILGHSSPEPMPGERFAEGIGENGPETVHVDWEELVCVASSDATVCFDLNPKGTDSTEKDVLRGAHTRS